MRIERQDSVSEDWVRLRQALWPDGLAAHRDDLAELVGSTKQAGWLAWHNGEPAGFAEAAIRHDYVNGCDHQPAAFLEGLYVIPALRHQGIARALVEAVRSWGLQQGCNELASDAPLDNLASQSMHHRLGFVETERVVYYRMPLQGGTS